MPRMPGKRRRRKRHRRRILLSVRGAERKKNRSATDRLSQSVFCFVPLCFDIQTDGTKKGTSLIAQKLIVVRWDFSVVLWCFSKKISQKKNSNSERATTERRLIKTPDRKFSSDTKIRATRKFERHAENDAYKKAANTRRNRCVCISAACPTSFDPPSHTLYCLLVRRQTGRKACQKTRDYLL